MRVYTNAKDRKRYRASLSNISGSVLDSLSLKKIIFDPNSTYHVSFDGDVWTTPCTIFSRIRIKMTFPLPFHFFFPASDSPIF